MAKKEKPKLWTGKNSIADIDCDPCVYNPGDMEYILRMTFKCKTQSQCEELSEILEDVFNKKVEQWSSGFSEKFEALKRTAPKSKMPKNFGNMK